MYLIVDGNSGGCDRSPRRRDRPLGITAAAEQPKEIMLYTEISEQSYARYSTL